MGRSSHLGSQYHLAEQLPEDRLVSDVGSNHRNLYHQLYVPVCTGTEPAGTGSG